MRPPVPRPVVPNDGVVVAPKPDGADTPNEGVTVLPNAGVDTAGDPNNPVEG